MQYHKNFDAKEITVVTFRHNLKIDLALPKEDSNIDYEGAG